ncbi:HEAT repeat domain-containing protein [Nostoc sp. XA010]|nr:HEAT repeat domain-containing protein [Nostoc sp. XA010]MCC5656572.1 HEAT repeat domain-containing protein [Nostoc sp. XA010]
MLITPRHTNKLSVFFLFCFTLLLTFFLSLPWVNAKETPKRKPQDWQINGISAALDDGHDQVKIYALDKLVEYDLKDLKSLVKKPEDIAEKAAKILKDEKVDADVRSSAASALGNLGNAAAKYLPDILNILKDEKVDAYVRSGAASALVFQSQKHHHRSHCLLACPHFCLPQISSSPSHLLLEPLGTPDSRRRLCRLSPHLVSPLPAQII